jgi:hypothetical protein
MISAILIIFGRNANLKGLFCRQTFLRRRSLREKTYLFSWGPPYSSVLRSSARGQELIDQIAVGRMDLDQVKPAFFALAAACPNSSTVSAMSFSDISLGSLPPHCRESAKGLRFDVLASFSSSMIELDPYLAPPS